MNRRNYGDSLVNLVGLQKQLLPKNPATPALIGCQSWEVQNKTILISGGLRGLQIEIDPQKLIDYLKMVVGDIIEDIEVKNIAILD